MPREIAIRLIVNNRLVEATVPARLSLADFLRSHLGLTGTHLGCEHGVCGACTVLLDGKTARSCLQLAVQVDGRSIMTVEGLATAGKLHELQNAFRDTHALQCGFCTPGMLMAALELLKKKSDPTEEDIRSWLAGNICRCTGYQPIVEAVKLAASRLRHNGRK